MVFQTAVTVDEAGQFSYEQSYDGSLVALPIDIVSGTPVGTPFEGHVWGNQRGAISSGHARVAAFDKKMTHEGDGPQYQFLNIGIGETGKVKYRAFERCFGPE